MVTISRVVKVKVPVEGGETVTLVCRRPTSQELSGFLNARFDTRGKKVKSKLYEARTALINKILVNVEDANFEKADGGCAMLNAQTVLSEEDQAHWSGLLGTPVTGWKDLIPVSWMSSAAMAFEDPAPEDEDDSGN